MLDHMSTYTTQLGRPSGHSDEPDPHQYMRALSGLVESTLVLGTDGGVEEPPVTRAHLGGGVFYMRVIQRW